MSRFLNDRLEAARPYKPGEQASGFVKLNTNECPYPPSPLVARAVSDEASRLNLYSDPKCDAVLGKLAKTLGVDRERVFAANGSDEALAVIFAAFCQGGAAYPDITYGFYPALTALFGVGATTVPLRDGFVVEPRDYDGVAGTVVIANPNAPTGLALGLDEIESVAAANRNRLVVIDEAYVDFGAQTAVPLIERYDNLIVVGTFSKSRQLAGGRFGYVAADVEIINDLEKIRYSFNPYNVNAMTQAAAYAALADAEYFESCRAKIIATRERTLSILNDMGFAVTRSVANFAFITREKTDASALYRTLRENGVLTRHWDAPRIKDYLRVTIGTDEQMDFFFNALRKSLRKLAPL
ncbi:MAG: aminotransferase class I/II-fold pyridoxal phosphate-dependent enzyme [Clostridiales bacterium]|jgi:histidinol-phosphate aminotransferase|nr:aminotransferase class I/II-fold pyridoxal phosphate-dependent enzyme [Clostridiales bacterium]